jgi:regulator of replication initiation timing
MAQLYVDYRDKVEKEIELDRSIHALTIVAEHQDHALAQANSAFSLVQEYNQHLETENRNLKNRLNSAEIAERSRSGNDAGNKTMIPAALFNLLKPNN